MIIEDELKKVSLGNAAGTIKTLDDVQKACRSAMTEITVGSVTLEPRTGNLGEIYYYHPTERWSLNSLGLPNPGLSSYAQVLPEMVICAHEVGKRLRVSVAGFSPDEYAILAAKCVESGADEVELNLGCPNVWGSTGQKPIASYHPELTAQILEKVQGEIKGAAVAVKISPVDDIQLLTELARVIDESDIVYKVVASNTIPKKERQREDGKSALSFTFDASDTKKKHEGGLAGASLLQLSLQTVSTLATLLPEQEIIGVGGIFTGEHAMHYWRYGVSGFQCATAFLVYGPKIFSEIFAYLSEPAQ